MSCAVTANETTTELYRSRLLDLEQKMRPARVVSSVGILIAVLASVPWLGWWPLAVIAFPPITLLVSERLSKTSDRPQLWIMLGVVAGISVAAATGSIITGGIASPIIVLFLIPALSVALRFEGRVLVLGSAIVFAAVAATAVSDVDALRENPVPLFFLVAAMVSISAVTRTVKRIEVKYRVESEMDRLKKDFLAKVTHDLRSPITSIRGYIDMVSTGEGGEVTEQQHAYLDIAAANADRLETLIDNLLTASKLEAGIELDREQTDVVEVIDRLVLSLQPIVKKKSLTLEVEGPAHFTLSADPSALERAVANLVGNAAKFSPEGGRIVVGIDTDGELCSVSVTDEGPGIPPDELEKLGTRFFRASTGQGTKGTGLGLAITREIAELHGGRLDVESVLGEGATFSVRLPIQEAGGEATPEAPVQETVVANVLEAKAQP